MAILLTGLNIPDSAVVPGGLQYTRTGSKQADMLRVNTGIKPNAAGACVFGAPAAGPSRLGALDGDLCGFPNGRRLLDDVTDIEVRALMEGYGPTLNAVLGVPNRTPNNLLGDGVDANDTPFLSSFPYIGTPQQGYSHMPRPPRDRRSVTGLASARTARAHARAVSIRGRLLAGRMLLQQHAWPDGRLKVDVDLGGPTVRTPT